MVFAATSTADVVNTMLCPEGNGDSTPIKCPKESKIINARCHSFASDESIRKWLETDEYCSRDTCILLRLSAATEGRSQSDAKQSVVCAYTGASLGKGPEADVL